jgi:hypothetical protein
VLRRSLLITVVVLITGGIAPANAAVAGLLSRGERGKKPGMPETPSKQIAVLSFRRLARARSVKTFLTLAARSLLAHQSGLCTPVAT